MEFFNVPTNESPRIDFVTQMTSGLGLVNGREKFQVRSPAPLLKLRRLMIDTLVLFINTLNIRCRGAALMLVIAFNIIVIGLHTLWILSSFLHLRPRYQRQDHLSPGDNLDWGVAVLVTGAGGGHEARTDIVLHMRGQEGCDGGRGQSATSYNDVIVT